MENQEYKIFSVSEIHGSELCYRKVLKLAICDERPDVLVLYGNITGNKVIPISKAKRNNNGIIRECKYEGKEYFFKDEEQVNMFISFLAAKGDYGYKCTNVQHERFNHNLTERNKIIRKLKVKRIKYWVKMADATLIDNHSQIIIIPGTDDPFEIDAIFEKSKKLKLLNNKHTKLNHDITVVGFANSAFNQKKGIPEQLKFKQLYRNIDDDDILKEFDKIEGLFDAVDDFDNSIFYIPFPPKNTNLDNLSNGKKYSIGSQGVREIIERYKPRYSFHSFIIENCVDRIGDTDLINPGSEYYSGKLIFDVIVFNGYGFSNFQYGNDPFSEINLPMDPENSDDIDDTFVNIIFKYAQLIPYGKYIKIVKDIIEDAKKDGNRQLNEKEIEEKIKEFLTKHEK